MQGIPRDHRTVLVGSTLGPESDAVVGTALAIARHSGGRVSVLHVLEPPDELAAGLLTFASVREGVSGAARERLAAQLRRLGAKTSEVHDISVEVPPVHVALLGAVERSRAERLVLGANGRDLRSPRFGAVSLRLLRRLPRPLWLVRRPGPLVPGLVLVPVDLTQLSSRALHHSLAALASCVPLAATEVLALRVLGDDDTRNEVEAQGELDRALAGYASPPAGRLRGIVRRGVGPRAVLAALAEEGADLLLLAKCERNEQRRGAADPVLESLAREARCAVLVVRFCGDEREP
jgi:nucleotide-binding universal stress UspA family protein